MKKILFAILAFVCLVGISYAQEPSAKSAQRPVGDTITDAGVDYYFDEYDFLGNHCSDQLWYYSPLEVYGVEVQTCPGWPPMAEPHRNYIFGTQMYAQRPLKVLGVAACCYAQRAADTTTYLGMHMIGDSWDYYGTNMREDLFFRNTIDERLESRVTDSLIIYRLDGDDPHWLASGPWRAEDPHRSILLKDEFSYGTCYSVPVALFNPLSPYTTDSVFPLYEVMFKDPVYVHGSFMVAGTALNNEDTNVYREPPSFPAFGEYMNLRKVRPTRYWTISNHVSPDECNEGPTGRWWKCLDGNDNAWVRWRDTIYYEYSSQFPDGVYVGYANAGFVIFPIIDTTFDSLVCDQMSAVRRVSSTDTSLTLTWNGGNNVEWMLRYVEARTTDTLIAYSRSSTYTIQGLRPNTSYFIWVSARCDSLHEFGEWSDLVPATTLPGQTSAPSSGILIPFALTPNPAKDYVTITCQPGIGPAEVTMSNALGQEVRHAVVAEGGTRLSLQGLPAGVYLVSLKTAQGSGTQRLVVE